MPDTLQQPQQPAALRGLKSWGIQPDPSPYQQFRSAHPWIAGASDFLTNGLTDPYADNKPARAGALASGLAGAGVSALEGDAIGGLKQAIMRPDAQPLSRAEAVGLEPNMSRRGFLNMAGNKTESARRDLIRQYGPQRYADFERISPSMGLPNDVSDPAWSPEKVNEVYDHLHATNPNYKMLDDLENRGYGAIFSGKGWRTTRPDVFNDPNPDTLGPVAQVWDAIKGEITKRGSK